MSTYRVVQVDSATGPAFEAAWRLLHEEFGRRGELERKSVVAGWLERGRRESPELDIDYLLLTVLGGDGELAGVRDCHLVIDHQAQLGVLYLAHILVHPRHRRRGVARLLRDAPIATLRERIGTGQRWVIGEMEHPTAALESVVRLVAYGRGGFQAIDPRALPYQQPDFRDPASIEVPEPVPLLLIAASLDEAHPASVDHRLAEGLLRHLERVFATHCDPSHLAFAFGPAHRALAASNHDVALLPLPVSTDDTARLLPLYASARGD